MIFHPTPTVMSDTETFHQAEPTEEVYVESAGEDQIMLPLLQTLYGIHQASESYLANVSTDAAIVSDSVVKRHVTNIYEVSTAVERETQHPMLLEDTDWTNEMNRVKSIVLTAECSQIEANGPTTVGLDSVGEAATNGFFGFFDAPCAFMQFGYTPTNKKPVIFDIGASLAITPDKTDFDGPLTIPVGDLQLGAWPMDYALKDLAQLFGHSKTGRMDRSA